MTNAKHNEVVLMSGSLGFSALICLLNNGNNGQTETTANLLGPFWRMNSPRTENGGSHRALADAGAGDLRQLLGQGSERQADRRRRGRRLAFLAGRLLRAAGSRSRPTMNLRGKFMTDEEGHFGFRSVKPAGYPIPIDGPVGDLVRAGKRHNFRPAHLHFLIFKEGFKTLISQIYVNDDDKLETDVQFGVTRALIGDYVRHDGPGAGGRREGRVVFARSDFRDGAGQKPPAQAADRVMAAGGERDRSRAVDLARGAGVPLSAMNAVSSSAIAGAPARAAEPPDLCAHRRRAGGGRRCCIGRAFSTAGCGCAGWRWRSSSPPASPTFSTAISPACWGQQSSLGRMLDPIADKLLVASCLLMLAAEETHPRLVAARRRHHPVPRNPGVGPARISRRAARQRAGDAARQVEDHRAAGGDRIPDRGRGRRQGPAGRPSQIGIVLLWLSALLTLYTGWDYMRAGLRYMIDE